MPRALAGRLWFLLREDRSARQKAPVATGDCFADPRAGILVFFVAGFRLSMMILLFTLAALGRSIRFSAVAMDI